MAKKKKQVTIDDLLVKTERNMNKVWKMLERTVRIRQERKEHPIRYRIALALRLIYSDEIFKLECKIYSILLSMQQTNIEDAFSEFNIRHVDF